jgi:hypothetical protein
MRLIDADALDKRIYEEIPIKEFGTVKRMARMREIVGKAPTVALSENSITRSWTPDADVWVKKVAERALDELEYKGRTIREWVELIMGLPEPPEEVSGDDA